MVTVELYVSNWVENEDDRENGDVCVAEHAFCSFFDGWLAARRPDVMMSYHIGTYRPDNLADDMRAELEAALAAWRALEARKAGA